MYASEHACLAMALGPLEIAVCSVRESRIRIPISVIQLASRNVSSIYFLRTPENEPAQAVGEWSKNGPECEVRNDPFRLNRGYWKFMGFTTPGVG